MEAKSIPEVAFEWLCECGAYDQLRKQCECYTADCTVSVFSLYDDLTDSIHFSQYLYALYWPRSYRGPYTASACIYVCAAFCFTTSTTHFHVSL